MKGKFSISDDHVKNVCQPGTKHCCAYLSMGPTGCECCKIDPGMKGVIDARLKAGTINATGDNCEGPGIKKILN